MYGTMDVMVNLEVPWHNEIKGSGLQPWCSFLLQGILISNYISQNRWRWIHSQWRVFWGFTAPQCLFSTYFWKFGNNSDTLHVGLHNLMNTMKQKTAEKTVCDFQTHTQSQKSCHSKSSKRQSQTDSTPWPDWDDRRRIFLLFVTYLSIAYLIYD